MEQVLLDHGSGGKLARELIESLFLSAFGEEALQLERDAALLPALNGRPVFTTDSHVVKPLFFAGGDIGTLAVSGTVNDLVVGGARALYLSAGFVIEEGFPIAELQTIAESMARAAREAGVRIVCGDTKVVARGECDGVFITTAGLGELPDEFQDLGDGAAPAPGDRLIVSGHIADHGVAILAARNGLETDPPIASDCAPLGGLVEAMRAAGQVRFMRDPTRGGVATVLCELSELAGARLRVHEEALPLRDTVRGLCEMFGFDPLYLANEGKLVAAVAPQDTEAVLAAMRRHELGRDAAVIGEVEEAGRAQVVLETAVGGRRVLQMHTGAQLPRIC